MAGATWSRCHLSTHSVYTIQPCTSLQCHFMQSHICRVHACLAVTCHLHFWQNDQDLLHATVVTQFTVALRPQRLYGLLGMGSDTAVEQILKWVNAESWSWRKIFFLSCCCGLLIMHPALYHWAILAISITRVVQHSSQVSASKHEVQRNRFWQ